MLNITNIIKETIMYYTRINSPVNSSLVELFGSWNNWSGPATSRHVDHDGTLYFVVNLNPSNSDVSSGTVSLQFKFKVCGQWLCNGSYETAETSDGFTNNVMTLSVNSSHQQDQTEYVLVSPVHHPSVELYGSWNNWSEPAQLRAADRDNDVTYFMVHLEPSVRHQFKFKLGGRWLTNDQYLHSTDSNGNVNNVVSPNSSYYDWYSAEY